MSGTSLLSFIDAPVVVGDPEGCVVYLNPAFEARLGTSPKNALGMPLAELFAGGGREAILNAVALVCSEGASVRFQLIEGDTGFHALASPIEADADRVGVIILLTEEAAGGRRALRTYREIWDSLEEIGSCLDELFEQTGGKRAERFRTVVERAMSAVGRVRKWGDELHGILSGQASGPEMSASFDLLEVVRQSVGRVDEDCARAGVALDQLVPASLPSARGDATHLEAALVELLRHRLDSAERGASLTLSARSIPAERALLIALVEPTEEGADRELPPCIPEALERMLITIGAQVHVLSDPDMGRVTSIRLPEATDPD